MGFEYWAMKPLIKDKATPADDEVKLLPPSLISRYENLWGVERVDLYNRTFLFPVLSNGSAINESTWKFFHQPKIGVRGVATRLSAIADEEGYGLLVAVHGIQPLVYSYNYMVVLLNSSLLNWLHIGQFSRCSYSSGLSQVSGIILQKITYSPDYFPHLYE